MEALARGELPPHVRDRLSRQWHGGTWSSNLSVAELAAIRSVGFTPAGQVMGSSVHRVAWQGQYVCQRYRYRTTRLTPFSDSLKRARGLALARMEQEAIALDAHGVVGVRIAFRWFPEVSGAVEYTAMGTAIRRPGTARLAAPFLSGLDGQDFAKVLRDGLVPCGLAIGLCTLHVHVRPTRGLAWQTAEVPHLAEAAAEARAAACGELAVGVMGLRGDGSVGASAWQQVWLAPCTVSDEPDYVVQFTVEGTAVSRFARPGSSPPRPVLDLGR
jgi:uncharacterized protein YbjQ (UPF0145 family)